MKMPTALNGELVYTPHAHLAFTFCSLYLLVLIKVQWLALSAAFLLELVSQLGPYCVESAFLGVLQFPPTVQRHAG